MKNLLAFLRENTPNILADIQSIVQIESPSHHTEGINRVQDLAQAWLGEFGMITRYPGDAGDVLLARIRGQSAERVVLLAHVDTVHPIGSWSCLWRTEGDLGYGPGSYDMKAGVVQALWALRAIHALGRQPAWSVDLLLTPDEETCSDAGRPYIEKYAQNARAVLVLEAPFMNGDLKIARKGV